MAQKNDTSDIRREIEQESSGDEEPDNLQYKVVVLGNGTVGKTSIIMRFCEDYFAKSYKQTIGVDFFVKRLELPGNVQVTL
jgi:Ras-related protein Rab-28